MSIRSQTVLIFSLQQYIISSELKKMFFRAVICRQKNIDNHQNAGYIHKTLTSCIFVLCAIQTEPDNKIFVITATFLLIMTVFLFFRRIFENQNFALPHLMHYFFRIHFVTLINPDAQLCNASCIQCMKRHKVR